MMGKVIMSGIVPPLVAPISGILASDLAVGSVVKLMENGVATEYLVVNQGKPSGSSLYDDSCDGTWLLRKDIHSNRQWDSSDVNDYANSEIHEWLNGDYFNQLGVVEQATIKQVKIPYRVGSGSGSTVNSGINGLSTRVFLLGGMEAGFKSTNCPVDGALLPLFTQTTGNDENRIAYLDGAKARWFLRSAGRNTTSTNSLWGVDTNGSNWFGVKPATLLGIRPALILPSNALFGANTMLLKGVA